MGKINVGFRNKKSKSGLIAAIALSAVIATTTGNCQFASAAEVQSTASTQSTSVVQKTSTTQNTIESFVTQNGQKYSIPAENKAVIGKTVEDQKIKVTLVDCYADTSMLMFTTHLDSTQRDDYAQDIKPKIYINNKLIDIYDAHCGVDYIHNENNTTDILTRLYLDDIKDLDMSQNLNITIDYGTIGVTSKSDIDTDITGNWKFDFTINASQIDKQILTKEINQNIQIENHKLSIKGIKVFPNRIELTTGDDLDIDSDDTASYVIKDDKGNEYKSTDGHGSKTGMMSNYLINTNDIKTITINPRTGFNNAKSTVNYDKAITINLK